MTDEEKNFLDPEYLRCKQCGKLQHHKKLNLVSVKLSTEIQEDCAGLNIVFCPKNPECKQKALKQLLDMVEVSVFNFVECYE